MRLDLDSMPLKELPETIFYLPSLCSLNVNSTQIEKLPETLGMCSMLKQLTCIMNRLTQVPDSICQLVRLQELNFSSNRITALPERIHHLEQLQCLNMDRNPIQSLPKMIGYLPNLRKLHISDCRLEYLPASVAVRRNHIHVVAMRNPFVEPVLRNNPGPKSLMDSGLISVAMSGKKIPDGKVPKTVTNQMESVKKCDTLFCHGRYTEATKITGISNVHFANSTAFNIPVRESVCSLSCTYGSPAHPEDKYSIYM